MKIKPAPGKGNVEDQRGEMQRALIHFIMGSIPPPGMSAMPPQNRSPRRRPGTPTIRRLRPQVPPNKR